jgi:hypothetical protein
MAKQKGFLHLKGNMGDTNFFKSRKGDGARNKGGIEAGRIASDPSFERTRENMAEFGRAATAGKHLRRSLKDLLKEVKDRTRSNRLTAMMMAVLKADSTSDRGLRNVIDGEAELLAGFEFNQNAPLGAIFTGEISAEIDRGSGAITVSIPSFIPKTGLEIPEGATHVKLVSAGLSLDFSNGVYVKQVTSSAFIPLDMNDVAAMTLVNTVTPNSTHPLFAVAGILFLQEANGKMYPLLSGSFNSLSIVKVSGL